LVELKISIAKNRITYIPKDIVEQLGRKLKVIANARSAVIFPEDAEYEEVIESLKVILADLELRARLKRGERR